jgi:hypothetical protein
MKTVKTLWLDNNKLCSLPSEIAQLETLEALFVRLSSDWIATVTLFSVAQKPAHVSSARARSADQTEESQRAALEADGS